MIPVIKVTVDDSDLKKRYSDLQKSKIPSALSKAIDATAKEILDAAPDRLEQQLDRPTPFTKKGLYKKTVRATLTSEVGFKDIQAGYIAPQIRGGKRGKKKLELSLPKFATAPRSKRLRKNQYGNLSKAQIKSIIEAKNEKNTSAKDKRYFFGKPKGAKHEQYPIGIYARVKENKRIVPLLIFASQPTYKKRFGFSALAREVVNGRFRQNFEIEFAKVLAKYSL